MSRGGLCLRPTFYAWVTFLRRNDQVYIIVPRCTTFTKPSPHIYLYMITFKLGDNAHSHYKFMRGSRGGSGGPDTPPRDLSEVGSCVDVCWVREGVQRLFLSYYYNFFLAHRVNVWKIPPKETVTSLTHWHCQTCFGGEKTPGEVILMNSYCP